MLMCLTIFVTMLIEYMKKSHIEFIKSSLKKLMTKCKNNVLKLKKPFDKPQKIPGRDNKLSNDKAQTSKVNYKTNGGRQPFNF